MLRRGCMLVILAVFVLALVASSTAWAQGYKGSASCKMCHQFKNKAIIDGFYKTGHPKALQDASKEAAAVVAVFDDKSPIKKDQIKYTLGVGGRSQAYIGADMKTLPAEWSVTDKKWVVCTSQDAKTQCIGCHVTGLDSAKSTWVETGVNCESCHGAGAAHAGSGDKTKILNPKSLTPDKQMMICGQCHSKGTDTTKTYAFPVTYKPGGDLTQSFIDAKPTTMGRNQQYSDFIRTKHYAKAVTCLTCHEPHGAGTTEPTQLKKPIIALCLGCHAGMEMAKHAPTAPAGSTCATCHMPAGRHTFAKPGA